MSDAATDRLLGLIKRRGPQRIADVASVFGITAEAARQQLLRLADRALVQAGTERGGVGRPAQMWRLTDAGHARFPDTHAELTAKLIGAIRSELGELALDHLIAVREAETRDLYRTELAGIATLARRVGRLAELRNREGYMAEWRRAGTVFLLLENHCPICTAATECQGFCRSELSLFRDVLGPGVEVERTEHILAGARRCAYRIKPTQAQKETQHGLDRRRRAG
jgi:predicted ArsR family transcriptional regulator